MAKIRELARLQLFFTALRSGVKLAANLILLTGAMLLCPVFADAQRFVVAWSAVSALNSPFWVMNDAGFWKQEGLDIQLVYIASSPTVARATLAGEIVLSGANSQVIVDVGLGGGDLVAMGAITNVVAFYVMAAPEVKTVNDLKGKVVGVTRFGASTDFGMRMLLSKYGLEPAKDVPFIQIGGMPELAAALSKKTVFAAPMSQPMVYLAQQAGMRMIANLAKEEIPFMHIGLTTSRKWIREHRPQAKAFVRAYARALHFMHTRREETRSIFAKYTRINDQAMLDGSIQYGYDFMEKIPLVKPQAFQVTLDQVAKSNPKAKQAKPEQFFDNSLVQELIDEGFFAKLWGKNPQ
ncbi:MAG TPA: ABC transporter substrate-binding protein [Candidatus Binatia bacterium]|nr:ABC transporter substrate-binding protein [Candidatus Binatia bacterium]